MPLRTKTRPRKKSATTTRKEQATTEQSATAPEQRLGGRLVGMGLGLLVLLALQSSVLIGSIPLVGLATMISGLFMVSLVASGAQIWRGALPEGRLVSLLSGSGALWLAILGGLLLASAGFVAEWQSGYARDYATSTLPLITGGALALLLGGWVSSALHRASRIRRAVMLYSGLGVVTSAMMAAMFSALSPMLLLSCGAHLLIFWAAWRLRADTEALNQRSLEDLW